MFDLEQNNSCPSKAVAAVATTTAATVAIGTCDSGTQWPRRLVDWPMALCSRLIVAQLAQSLSLQQICAPSKGSGEEMDKMRTARALVKWKLDEDGRCCSNQFACSRPLYSEFLGEIFSLPFSFFVSVSIFALLPTDAFTEFN